MNVNKLFNLQNSLWLISAGLWINSDPRHIKLTDLWVCHWVLVNQGTRTIPEIILWWRFGWLRLCHPRLIWWSPEPKKKTTQVQSPCYNLANSTISLSQFFLEDVMFVLYSRYNKFQPKPWNNILSQYRPFGIFKMAL